MKKPDIFAKKKLLRKKVASVKQSYSRKELDAFSEEVICTLELTELFQKAKVVCVYYSMQDEVDTRELIKKYAEQKQFVLPVVNNNELILKKYVSEANLSVSTYGIKEPEGEIFSDYDAIDLVIVPGVAFDRALNRMGRGKGFYDNLLPKIKASKVAVCFDFQLFNEIPAAQRDIKMNMIVCENEIIVE